MSTTLNSVACDIPASHVDALAKMMGGLSLVEAPAVNVDALAEIFDGWHLSEAPAYEEPLPAYCKTSQYFKELPPAYGDIEQPSDEFVHHWVYEWEHVADRLDWLRPERYTDEAGVSFDFLRWRRRWAEFARANPDDHHNYLLRICDGCVYLEARCRMQMGREFYPPGTEPPRPIRREPAARRALPGGEHPIAREVFGCVLSAETRAAREAFVQTYRARVLDQAMLIE